MVEMSSWWMQPWTDAHRGHSSAVRCCRSEASLVTWSDNAVYRRALLHARYVIQLQVFIVQQDSLIHLPRRGTKYRCKMILCICIRNGFSVIDLMWWLRTSDDLPSGFSVYACWHNLFPVVYTIVGHPIRSATIASSWSHSRIKSFE